MEEIYAAHPIATLMVGPSGRIEGANTRAEVLLNMARAALVGLPVEQALRVQDPDLAQTLWSTDKPLSAYDCRVNAGRVSGLEMDILVSPVADREGWRVVALHPHGQARRMAAGYAGRSARSAIGAAAMLAHEIKNPLSGIRGAAQLIDSSDDRTRQSMTVLICQEVDRIAALIDRMQDFTTDPVEKAVPTNIYPMLDRAVELAEAGFARGITIKRDFDPSLPPALIHPDALVQVMINLVKNAAEALDQVTTPVIMVTTSYRHGLSLLSDARRGQSGLPIEIQVIDNGPGVPDQIVDDLFAPFVTGKRSGQGLGLALVDKQVRDMGGLVQYERAGNPARTIFRVLLPVARS